MKKQINTHTMIPAAMFLALAYVLPFLTGQIPQIGSMLCPMHIPVLLCGFICGWQWGLVVGFIAPLLRAMTLGTPLLFPTGICMAFELATYGAVAGLLHRALPKKKSSVYGSLLMAMISGRLVLGVVMFICMGIQGGGFGFSAFLTGAVINALPGIMVQIILIPVLVMMLDKANFSAGETLNLYWERKRNG